MERRDCLKRFTEMGVCAGALSLLGLGNNRLPGATTPADELAAVKAQKEFIQNWLTDLLATMDKVLDRETIARLMAGCGRGCFDRHKFKQDIAAQGKGDLEKLIAAYDRNFEIWKEGEAVHIRYGKASPGCYCPAANYRAPKADDPHCDCTRATHQAIFETALGRPFKVEVLESVRRGGVTCHFLVRPA
jgi:hypothetical protein